MHIDWEREDDDDIVAQAYAGGMLIASAMHELLLIRKALTDGGK